MDDSGFLNTRNKSYRYPDDGFGGVIYYQQTGRRKGCIKNAIQLSALRINGTGSVNKDSKKQQSL